MAATTVSDSGGSTRGRLTRRAHSLLTSTIGTKVVVALTGSLLVVYLVIHLFGNLFVFLGSETYNRYSAILLGLPIILPIEIALAATFFLHIYKAGTNWVSNRAARPVPYHRSGRRIFGYGWARGPSRKSLPSSTMIFSGLVIALFVLIHVRQFRFGVEYVLRTAGDVEVRDLYRLEMEIFSNPLVVAFYTLAIVLVGSHLYHGIGSMFSSLGIEHPRWTPWLLRFGRALAVLLTLGFVTIPLWVYFVGAPAYRGGQ